MACWRGTGPSAVPTTVFRPQPYRRRAPVHPGENQPCSWRRALLDELAEFPTGVLQTLRQPIERGYVRIVRVDGAFTFPSRFQLLAASNPCPCGFLGDREVPCRCSAAMVERYRSKLRGPLADRIDMMIDVTRPTPSDYRGAEVCRLPSYVTTLCAVALFALGANPVWTMRMPRPRMTRHGPLTASFRALSS